MSIIYFFEFATFVTFFFLLNYVLISPLISSFFFRFYDRLECEKKYEWNSRINSTLHAFIVCSFSCLILLFDDTVKNDPVYGQSDMAYYNLAFVIGYMSSDFILMIKYYHVLGGVFYVIHHIASIVAFGFVLIFQTYAWFAIFRIVAEFSTPFVNQRWFLETAGYDHSSTIYIVNGLSLAFMFFAARIFTMPYYYFQIYRYYHNASYNLKMSIFWILLILVSLALDSINVYWFHKIVKGAYKVLFGGSKIKSSSSNFSINESQNLESELCDDLISQNDSLTRKIN